MRLRCSERSATFGDWDPKSLEVPKRVSEEIEPPSLLPGDLLAVGTGAGVSFAGCFSVRGCPGSANGASAPLSVAGGKVAPGVTDLVLDPSWSGAESPAPPMALRRASLIA